VALAAPNCTREVARDLVRNRIGYEAGYHSNETRARVERLFQCEHPFFGKIAEKGPPTADQALRMGFEAGRRIREEAEKAKGTCERTIRAAAGAVVAESLLEKRRAEGDRAARHAIPDLHGTPDPLKNVVTGTRTALGNHRGKPVEPGGVFEALTGLPSTRRYEFYRRLHEEHEARGGAGHFNDPAIVARVRADMLEEAKGRS
jgi:hypothetical protein